MLSLARGTMGALHRCAPSRGAGVPSYLFDIVPPDADGPARNKIAAAGLDAAKKSKPAAFMEPALARLITIGNFDDDLKRLAEVDWIIEAVVENLDLKRALLRKVEAIRKPGTIITTNTSGLPVGKIARGFLRRLSPFVVWDFTSSIRRAYMRLLENHSYARHMTRAAIDAVCAASATFIPEKALFTPRIAPNFIGNRIGTSFRFTNVMRLMQEMDLSIEDIDALTGQALGWLWVSDLPHH